MLLPPASPVRSAVPHASRLTLRACAVLLLGAASEAGAQLPYYFPANQWGTAELAMPQNRTVLESVFNRVPNFEPIVEFTESNRYRRLATAIGRLDILLESTTGERVVSTCTATLIADDHVLTNHHCVPGVYAGYTVEEALLRLSYLSQDDQHGETFTVDVVPVESDADLDYSVLFVSGNPGRRYGSVPLRVRDPRPREELFLIHHPGGAPQRITRRGCRLTDSPRAVTTRLMRHRCDTRGGSSGSLIFSDNNVGDAFDVVGLHFAGFRDQSPDAYNSAKPLMSIVRRSRFLGDRARIVDAAEPPPLPGAQRPRPGAGRPDPVRPAPARTLAFGGTLSGRLSANARDSVSFSGRSGDVVDIGLESADFDTYVELHDSRGATLAEDDDGGEGLNSRVEAYTLPRSGTYWVVARGYGSGAGAYRVSLARGTRAGDALPCSPGGDPAYGQVAVGRRVRLGRHGTVRGSTNWASAMDGYVDRVTSVRSLAGMDASGCAVVRVDADDGQYAWRARAMTLVSDAPRTLAFDRAVRGSLAAGSAERWSFTGRAGDRVEITLASSDFDTYLELHDPDGDLVAEDDDSGEGSGSRIADVSLGRSGNHTVVVRGYDDRGRGAYELRMTRRARSLRYGGQASGRIRAGQVDQWSFAGRVGDRVRIDVASADFDTYVELKDASGTRVASDDDGGLGTNSVIDDVRLPRSGEYAVVVRAYDDTGAGSYTLDLAEAGATGAEVTSAGQGFTTSSAYPSSFRRAQWDADRYITSLAYGAGEWMLTMTERTPYTSQHNAVMGTYDEILARIREKWDEKYAITDFARGGGQWSVSMTLGTGLERQSYIVSDTFPDDWIEEKWDEGQRITSATFGDRQWIVVTSSGTGWGAQSWATRNSFDEMRTYITEAWDDGKRVTDIAHGNDVWLAVTTAGTGRGRQLFHRLATGDALRAFVEEQWGEGLHLDDVTWDGSYYWALFTAQGQVR